MEISVQQAIAKASDLKGDLAKIDAKLPISVVHEETAVLAYSYEELLKDKLDKQDLLDRILTEIALSNARTFIKIIIDEIEINKPVVAWMKQATTLKALIAQFTNLTVKPAFKTKEIKQEYDFTKREYVPKTVNILCDLPEKDRDALVSKWKDTFRVINDALDNSNRVTMVKI